MGQIGNTIGGLVGIGQDPGMNTFGASPYGQDYGALLQNMQSNYNTVNANQSALAQQYGDLAAGKGPNPAQAMLNQSTGQNVANQAALQAGQRGASGNVGLMARQAGHQGAQIQQQAAGQGASMQAQQQLGAMGQQAGIYGQQGQEAIGGLGAYEAAINSANQINAGSAESRAKYGQGFGGGLLTGVGSMLAEGGEVEPQKFAMGGMGGGDYMSPQTSMPSSGGAPNSFVGQFLSGSGGSGTGQSKGGPGGHGIISGFLKNLGKNKTEVNPSSGAQSLGSNSSYNQNLTPFGNSMASNPGMAAGNAGYAGADMGAADAAGSELGSAAAVDAGAEEGGAASIAEMFAAKGGRVQKLKSQGGHVPGQAKVKGNSYSNDHVKALLSPGEIVIPRSVTQSKDPINGAAAFVRDVLAKKKGKMA